MHKKLICIIDTGTAWLKELKENLIALQRTYTVIQPGAIPKTRFDKFAAIIIIGENSVSAEADEAKYVAQFRFLKATRVPVLGIGTGHHILGAVHGALVHPVDQVDLEEEIEVVTREPLFDRMRDVIPVREQRTDYISIPGEFNVLAESSGCNNEAMQHKVKPLFSVQFHPEVSGEMGREILKNFLSVKA